MQTKSIVVDFQQEIRVSANLQGVFRQDDYFVKKSKSKTSNSVDVLQTFS